MTPRNRCAIAVGLGLLILAATACGGGRRGRAGPATDDAAVSPTPDGGVVERDAGEPDCDRVPFEIPDPRCIDAGRVEPDAGPPDAGPPDAGPPDAGPPDAGPPDAGPPDAGPPDAGPPDAGPPDAGLPDAGPPPIPEECYTDPAPGPVPPLGPGICSVAVRGGTITPSRSTCFIDERVSGAAATLVYRCGGGEAHLVFGSHHFAGWVHPDGRVDLCMGTLFPFDDGCDWISAQQIYGDLADSRLSFAYTETPAPGFSGCYPSCTGSGSVRFE